MSCGPVGPGDARDRFDIGLIMKSCRADGKILKPDKPATAIDLQIVGEAFGKPMGQVWSTYTCIGNYQFGILFQAETPDTLSISVRDLNIDGLLSKTYVKFNNVSNFEMVHDISNITLSKLGSQESQITYFSPILYSSQQENVTLLGELDKWVPVSNDRIQQLTILPSVNGVEIQLEIVGNPQEVVTFTFLRLVMTGEPTIINITCHMPETGSATILYSKQSCL